MRFLFVDPNIEYLLRDEPQGVGGAAVQAFAWLRGLVANGEEVVCIARDPIDLPLPDNLTVVSGYKLSGGIGYLTEQYPFFRSLIDSFEPDFIYQGGAGTITGLLGLLSRSCEVRLIHMVANDADVARRRRERMRPTTHLAYNFGLKRCSAILCQTRYQYKMIAERFPGKASCCISKPIWLEEVPPSTANGDRQYVAWLGIFQWQKNLGALVEVAQRLPDFQFALAGKAAPKLDRETEVALTTLNKLNNVAFVGYLRRKEIYEFLQNAHALLSTSRFEGFPNTYLEAWAVGTPVVSLRNADPDGTVERNQLGATAEDPQQLASVLKRLVMSDEGRDMQNRCRRYVRGRHDAVRQAGRLVKWLDSIF